MEPRIRIWILAPGTDHSKLGRMYSEMKLGTYDPDLRTDIGTVDQDSDLGTGYWNQLTTRTRIPILVPANRIRILILEPSIQIRIFEQGARIL